MLNNSQLMTSITARISKEISKISTEQSPTEFTITATLKSGHELMILCQAPAPEAVVELPKVVTADSVPANPVPPTFEQVLSKPHPGYNMQRLQAIAVHEAAGDGPKIIARALDLGESSVHRYLRYIRELKAECMGTPSVEEVSAPTTPPEKSLDDPMAAIHQKWQRLLEQPHAGYNSQRLLQISAYAKAGSSVRVMSQRMGIAEGSVYRYRRYLRTLRDTNPEYKAVNI